MKWFTHEADAIQDPKLQAVLMKYGIAGYGTFFACVEYVAKEDKGNGTKLDLDSRAHFWCVKREWLEEVVGFFAEQGLVSHDHWQQGILYIPKLFERADNYTKKVRKKKVESPDTGVDDIKQLITDYWNAKPLPQIVAWSHDRSSKLSTRLKVNFFRDHWQEAIDKASESDFCMGRLSTSSWKMTIDFFIKSDDSIVKIMEGKYDNKARNKLAEELGVDE